jgi:hypothetical protein
MFGKKNTTDGLTYNFPTNAKLEIQLRSKTRMGDKVKTKWSTATPNVFRSFHGKRKVNDKTFKGQVFCFMTNAQYGIDAFMDGYKNAPVKSRMPEKKPLSIQIVKKGKAAGYTLRTSTDFSTGKVKITLRPFGK